MYCIFTKQDSKFVKYLCEAKILKTTKLQSYLIIQKYLSTTKFDVKYFFLLYEQLLLGKEINFCCLNKKW